MAHGSSTVTVAFDIWGQRAETTFTQASELSPAQWCVTVFNKGFAYPRQIIDGDTRKVLVNEDQMREILEDE